MGWGNQREMQEGRDRGNPPGGNSVGGQEVSMVNPRFLSIEAGAQPCLIRGDRPHSAWEAPLRGGTSGEGRGEV